MSTPCAPVPRAAAVIAQMLAVSVRAEDITPSLDLALVASGLALGNVHHRPHLLSGNAPCTVTGELADDIAAQRMSLVRAALLDPQAQGKIAYRHQTMKNRIDGRTSVICCPNIYSETVTEIGYSTPQYAPNVVTEGTL